MELHEQVATVNSKQELAAFVAALRHDLATQRDRWEDQTLERYLEAMEAWIRDDTQKNAGEPETASLAWRTFADILYAAKIYE